MGYDAGKRVKGRKVHALVDTEGLPLRVVVHSAAIQDRDGAALVLDRIRQRFNWLELVWADGGYNARQVEHAVAAQPPLRVEIVKRPDDSAGFIVLGPVAACVGIDWRVFGRHEAIRSRGEFNGVIVWLLGEGLPSVDLAHGDLS